MSLANYVPWNNTRRNWTWSSWKCDEKTAADSCPSGRKGDARQYESSKNCKSSSCDTGNCPTSCVGDQLHFLGACNSAIHNRERVRCFKNNYSTSDANKASCCSGNTPPQDCHIDYYNGGAACNNFMNTYCAVGNRAITDNNCKTWCNNNQTLCDNVKKSVCVGPDLSNPLCQSWCTRNPSDCKANIQSYCTPTNFSSTVPSAYCNQKAIEVGGMDSAVQTFCIDHPDIEFCSCYKSLDSANNPANKNDPTLQAILSRPECYVSQCSSGGGYKTTNMRNSGTCPSVNVCQNTLNALGNTSTGLENISQSCQQEQTTTTTNTSITPSSDSSPQVTETVTQSSSLLSPGLMEVSPFQSLFDNIGMGNLDPIMQYGVLFILIAIVFSFLTMKHGSMYKQQDVLRGGMLNNKAYE